MGSNCSSGGMNSARIPLPLTFHVRGNRVRETDPITDLAAIDEKGHMFAKPPLIVQHISTSPLVGSKVRVEDVPQPYAFDFARRARHVPLDVCRESDRRHGGPRYLPYLRSSIQICPFVPILVLIVSTTNNRDWTSDMTGCVLAAGTTGRKSPNGS